MNSAHFNMNRTYSLPRLPGCLRRSVALATVLGLGFGTLIADNAYWDQYGNTAVYVEQDNNGRKQKLKFLGYSNGMLVAEIEMKNPDGSTAVAEVSQPISQSMVQTLSLKLDKLPEADRQLNANNLEGALTILRPEVYPLVKFAEVPETFRQLHVPVQKLLNTLIRAQQYEEATDLIERIPLDKVSVEYSVFALQLINGYIAMGDYEAATALANRVPLDSNYAKNISPVMDIAAKLRNAEQYEAAIPLYRSVREVVPAATKANLDMWLAYSLVLANRLNEAVPIIDALNEPEPKERLFSLYKLLQGSLEYRKENYPVALDTLTRGFVRAQTSYSWVPEMLYLIGDCYKRSGEFEAARNVWTEISILYPDSPWAPRADSALAKLPPKPSTPAEQAQ